MAYLGIAFSVALAPWVSSILYSHYGWQMSLRLLGVVVILLSLPFVVLMKEPPASEGLRCPNDSGEVKKAFTTLALWLIIAGSMCSVGRLAQQNLKLR